MSLLENTYQMLSLTICVPSSLASLLMGLIKQQHSYVFKHILKNIFSSISHHSQRKGWYTLHNLPLTPEKILYLLKNVLVLLEYPLHEVKLCPCFFFSLTMYLQAVIWSLHHIKQVWCHIKLQNSGASAIWIIPYTEHYFPKLTYLPSEYTKAS